ncbi:hypothetical protein AGDE_14624 [Angomonas deanei]|nr:hypothetical protein AGDE_14624 [Angomonas deanei]|eukprot:EPY20529.1 hypothetical protein AGDE_14624 [Angomonas deanei]
MRSHTTPADQEELARGCLTQIARVVPTPVAKEFRLLDSVATEEQLERTLDALTSMSQSEDKNIFIANSIHRSLCRSFDLPLTNEDTTFHTVAESLERIEKCLLLLSTRMDSDKVGEARFIGLLQRAIEELAQLLPMIGGTTVSDASIRVKPPTLDIMEMIYLLKARLVESAQGTAAAGVAVDHWQPWGGPRLGGGRWHPLSADISAPP